MSQDIRSFFKVAPRKPTPGIVPSAASTSKKNPKRLIDSDDDDVILVSPQAKPQKNLERKQRPIIFDSDSENDIPNKEKGKTKEKTAKVATNKKQSVEILSSDSKHEAAKEKVQKKSDESKLKRASLSDMFKASPVKQSKVEPKKEETPRNKETEKKKSKSKKRLEKEAEQKVHANEDFEKTLDDLDDDFFENNMEVLDKTISEALLKEEKHQEIDNHAATINEKPARKRSRTDSTERSTPKKKKLEHTDSGIDPGQEAYEKKRHSALLYQKYLHRNGPKNHGVKEYPKGNSNCLSDLCFLKTGVLDSLESEEFETLIKEHGGRVVHGVSKKVNYVVVGEDAGPAKLAKAESYKIPTISEDELLDLILTKSNMKPKYCKKNNSGSSEDLGIDLDNGNHDDFSRKDKPSQAESKTKMRATKETPKKELGTVREKTGTPIKKANKNKEPETPSKKDKKPETTKKTNKEESKTLDKVETKIDPVPSNSFYSKPSTSKLPVKEQQHEDLSMLPLTEKYKPRSLKEVVGQQSEQSNLCRLKHWLENWHRNQDPKARKGIIRPSPWGKNDSGAYFKCALLSGPPGVGKTTTATLVARELGLDVVELNASDTRSKKSLHEEVAQMLHNKTIAGFATGKSNITNQRVLLMDEVDGMAGNEDRGGIQELILLIKNTNVPIICMCNDRNHQKMRSLVNYCFDLRFNKPRLEQIRGAMLSVCFKEKIVISAQALSEIISGTGCDLRQTLNQLAVLKSDSGSITQDVAAKEAKSSKKDVVMGPWEVCRSVFTKSDHQSMSVADRARLFFYDYSLGPLFVQENYLKVQPDGVDKKHTLLRAAFAAASLSTGDVLESKIRKTNNWSLLESQAFASSVLPGHYMAGSFTHQINFPGWLGKNSKKGKFHRLQGEIHTHTRPSTYSSKLATKLDYLMYLRNAVVMPLKRKGLEGIDDAISVMKTYNLLREDVDTLVELCVWTSKENIMQSIETKVKTAFTRTYNKQVTVRFAPSGASKRKPTAEENEMGEEEISDQESDDDLSKNAMIKLKKGKKNEVKTSGSKKGDNKKGKAKKGK